MIIIIHVFRNRTNLYIGKSLSSMLMLYIFSCRAIGHVAEEAYLAQPISSSLVLRLCGVPLESPPSVYRAAARPWHFFNEVAKNKDRHR